MSDTAKSTGTFSGAKPLSPDLGMPPLKIAALRFFGFGLGGIFLGATLGPASQGGAVLVVLGAIPWLFFMLFLSVRLLVLLSNGGNAGYRRVKTAIADGKIDVSYFLKGEDHLLVVDEPRRLLCLNGDLFDFDQVKRLETGSVGFEHRLTISLNSGANPVRNVTLHNSQDVQVAFTRVGNSLGFS